MAYSGPWVCEDPKGLCKYSPPIPTPKSGVPLLFYKFSPLVRGLRKVRVWPEVSVWRCGGVMIRAFGDHPSMWHVFWDWELLKSDFLFGTLSGKRLKGGLRASYWPWEKGRQD